MLLTKNQINRLISVSFRHQKKDRREFLRLFLLIHFLKQKCSFIFTFPHFHISTLLSDLSFHALLNFFPFIFIQDHFTHTNIFWRYFNTFILLDIFHTFFQRHLNFWSNAKHHHCRWHDDWLIFLPSVAFTTRSPGLICSAMICRYKLLLPDQQKMFRDPVIYQ